MLQEKPLFTLCCSIFLALMTGSLHADIYRWVDENGVVNFTQRKPSDIDALQISSSVKTTTTNADAEGSTSVPPPPDQARASLNLSSEQEEMYDSLKQKEAERQVEISRIKASNCKRSRALLQRLTANARIRVRANDGDERNLPDEERTQRIAEVQRGIVLNCLDG